MTISCRNPIPCCRRGRSQELPCVQDLRGSIPKSIVHTNMTKSIPQSFLKSVFRNLGTTPILKKRSRSEKAILVGATPGIPGYSRSNSRNGTHDLVYVKTLFSEQLSERLSERLSELVGRQNFSPNSRSAFFFKIGVIPPRQRYDYRNELLFEDFIGNDYSADNFGNLAKIILETL